VSKERAQRRAERETAQVTAKARAKKVRAKEKRQAKRRETTRNVADAPRRWIDRWKGNSILARRNRRRLAAAAGVIVAIQVLLWPFVSAWGARAGVLVGCIVMAPVVWVLAFGRV
jgi:Flp pilus assembly protein TadB